jgi:hypothetical protein
MRDLTGNQVTRLDSKAMNKESGRYDLPVAVVDLKNWTRRKLENPRCWPPNLAFAPRRSASEGVCCQSCTRGKLSPIESFSHQRGLSLAHIFNPTNVSLATCNARLDHTFGNLIPHASRVCLVDISTLQPCFGADKERWVTAVA